MGMWDEDKTWLKALKPGDKVVVCTGRDTDTLKTVEKVTPSGIVRLKDDGGRTFDAHGHRRGKRERFGAFVFLQQATPEAIQEIQRMNMVSRLSGMRSDDLKDRTYTQIADAYRALFPKVQPTSTSDD